MEDCEVRSCGLCFAIIKIEDSELLDSNSDFVHISKLNFDDDNKHVICKVCSIKLYGLQKFRMKCLYTDNAIGRYACDTTVSPLDLREIYMKERTNENVPEDVKICRLCMQTIKNDSEFKLINEEQVDMIQKFVPKMNIFTIKEPIMCKLCLDSLALHSNFLRKRLYMHQNIGNDSSVQIPDAAEISVKPEDVDIEFEGVPELIKTECVDINSEEIKTDSEAYGPEVSPGSAACEYQTEHNDCNFCYKTVNMPSLNKAGSNRKCEKYHESEHQAAFEEINVTEKQSSKVQLYKCETCNYKTQNKWHYKTHILVHKDPATVQMYKCENCDYQTKYKNALKTHMLNHKDPSQLQMYECETCNYRTKNKWHYKTHILVHRDASTVQMYKCGNCNYETKYKNALKSHMLNHQDPSQVQMYKCETCNYETNNKAHYKTHILVHKDPSTVQMYKCENCRFETKYKCALKKHTLKHKDPSQVQTYKCENCNYATKVKENLKRHMLIHKHTSEVQMYK